MTTQRPALLAGRGLVRRGRWEEARATLTGSDAEYTWTHDGMRNLNVRMQEAVYAHFGRADGDRLCDRVYQRMTDWAFGATDAPAFRDQVETFAMLWQWHRTPVRIVEDDEKGDLHHAALRLRRADDQRRRLSALGAAAIDGPSRALVRVLRGGQLSELVRALRVLQPRLSRALAAVFPARGLE